jgi:hypothetical protein
MAWEGAGRFVTLGPGDVWYTSAPMGWLQGIAGKVVMAVLGLAVVLAGISWWQADPATRSAVIDGIARVVGWAAAVLVLPWASFLLIGWVAKKDSNGAGVALVGALTVIEAAGLWFLFNFHVAGGAMWSMAIAAVLVAAVYNTFTCDWIAEKVHS